MDSDEQTLLQRMTALTTDWQTSGDGRHTFLACYRMMTSNMLAGVDEQTFVDHRWVKTFILRFAGYYETALAAYERDPATAPPVWRLAHDSARADDTWPLQDLLLGVNAHINYDLVLTVDELLHPTWAALSPDEQVARRQDYDRVNDIIAATIDAVQDEVLEPAMPIMEWVDRLLGRTDEWLLSRLLIAWRNDVWTQSARLLAADDPADRVAIVRSVEMIALRRADAIRLADWTAIDDLF